MTIRKAGGAPGVYRERRELGDKDVMRMHLVMLATGYEAPL